MRKTKIIATIGPASDNEETMRKLALAGMDCARFNFSHDAHSDHARKINLLKKIREELESLLQLCWIQKDRKSVLVTLKTVLFT